MSGTFTYPDPSDVILIEEIDPEIDLEVDSYDMFAIFLVYLEISGWDWITYENVVDDVETTE